MRLRLAQLDRARGEFIANASHELRTPLFSLGGFLELLDDPDARRGDPARVPRPDARAGRPPDAAGDRPARSVAPRRRPPVGRPETIDLSELADELAGRVPRPGGDGRPPARTARPSRRSRRSGMPSACSRSAASCSRTRSCTRRRGTTVRLGIGLDGGRATLTVGERRAGRSRRTSRSRCSRASTA